MTRSIYIFAFVASPPRVAPLEARIKELNVEALVSSQEGHRVEDDAAGGLFGAQLPTGLSLLDSLEAATRDDVVVGEGSDNNNPPSTAANLGASRPSSSQPSTLLLTRAGEELAQLGRVERLAELFSS